jgi:hydrogenase/urease accessory protein HupE
MPRFVLTFLFALVCLALPARASHEVRPGYLELRETDVETYDVLWKVPAKGVGLRLGIYVRFPDGTIESRDRPEHMGGTFVGDAYIERWSVSHPDGLTGQTIHIDGLRSTLTDVLVRVERLDGTTLVSRIEPAEPSLVLIESPGKLSIAATYFSLGVEHILLGIDHLLFVLALLMLVKGGRRLIGTITAFTVAHSITLAAATLGWAEIPSGPVEAVIALSIVFVASEIIHGLRGREGITARAPWIVALVFGLLHGFGFAGALREVGLPSHAIPIALLFFNVGVEAGQLAFVATVLVLVFALRRFETLLPARPLAYPAYGIGAVAAYWTLERVAAF